MMNRLSIDIFLPHFIQKYQYNIEENVERVVFTGKLGSDILVSGGLS